MRYFTYSAKRVLCLIRNYPVFNYPEERVRQKLLKQLLEVDEAYKVFIKLEVRTAKGRADIVIYDDQYAPLLTIELKSAAEIVSEVTLEQVMGYWETLQSPFVATSNGRRTKIYHVVKGTPKLMSETNIIKFLDERHIEYPEVKELYRLDFERSTYSRYVSYLTDVGYISDQTETIKQGWFAELQNAILTEKYVSTDRILPIEIEDDFGTSYVASKNAASGVWDGMHRNFRVRVKNKGRFIFRITILASASTINDKTFGNRVGATMLNVMMQKHKTSTYNLQLNLDKCTSESEDSYAIWHTGIKSRTSKEKVLKEVESYSPFLLKDSRIELAKLPNDRSISSDEFSVFIENLIVYSATRDRVEK